MSWSSSRRGALLAILCGALTLAGCTIAPVHGDRAGITTDPLPLAFASPGSRLEQVFYQTLAARLGTSGAPDAPLVTARVSTSASNTGLSDRREPATDRQVVATITYSIEKLGEIVASGRRTATAAYRATGQIVADDAARQNADEEAVRAAAQSVIAALLSDPALR